MRLQHGLRSLFIALAVLGLPVFILNQANAGGDDYFPPVSDPLVKEECGSCHLAFPAAMLPARSWQKMMANLGQHFGDDATVDPQTAAKITDYLVRNAADSDTQRYGRKFLRGLDPASTPLRITELPKWQREHRKIKDSEWRRKDVRSKANCAACHRGADAGDFGD